MKKGKGKYQMLDNLNSKLGFSVIRENYRPERNDWKSDLQCGNIELEIFGVSNPPARVSHPEAAKM